MKKIILVTGSNRGIGLEACNQLLKMGHTIIMGSRDVEKAKAATENLSGDYIIKKLDVTAEDDRHILFDEIKEEFGKLDVLINNAGVFSKSDVLNVTTEELNNVFAVNVSAPLMMAQAMVPLLEKSEDPRIVNVSSAMGQLSEMHPNSSAYRLSKFTLNGITIQLSRQLPQMKVNAMHPGWVRTDMGGAEAPLSVEQGADTAVWLATADGIETGCFYGERIVKDW